jgi:hypothetical protein
MLLVYTHKITPRLNYVFKHICTRVLNIPVSFTSKIEEFIAHDSLKMSYCGQQLGNEFHVKSHQILFEQGLSDIDIHVHTWDSTKCFFFNGDKSGFPFDIFGAAFYLLSRYEEYLPHVKDQYGRFMAKDSIAHKHEFLHQPVIDIWAYKFKAELQLKFPEFPFKERVYKVSPVIDIPMAYYFKNKGLMRTIGGTLNDIYRFKLRQLYQRYLVLFGLKKDPYDTFRWLINKQKKVKSKFQMFFLIGDYSTFDKNINTNKKIFVSLIKSVADYCKVGLKLSYFGLDNFEILKKEKIKMEAIINTSLLASRNSFNKLNLPNCYRNLINLEVKEDYSMGYVNEIGFRAGTCSPFLFYDLDYEIQTPLMIHSFQVMDYALLSKKSFLDKKQAVEKMIQEIQAVDGTFIPIFHNYTFSSEHRWTGFKDLFNLILKSVDETK